MQAENRELAPRKRGGQTIYTPEMADEICDRLATGEPMAQICRDEGMPNPSTVWRWCENDVVFAQRIARARDDGEDQIAANARRVARGESGFSTGDVLRDKLVIETDLKLLAKWNPRKWAERQQMEVGGTVSLQVVDYASLARPVQQIEGKAEDVEE